MLLLHCFALLVFIVEQFSVYVLQQWWCSSSGFSLVYMTLATIERVPYFFRCATNDDDWRLKTSGGTVSSFYQKILNSLWDGGRRENVDKIRW
ncbi:hypothetical protein MANES_04G021101v8 [Manihot esculenta]|uniref:Uncharacterized protein n=1 Tax=Manihot esculenta TaxID=3983 RepID=A0ACB7HWR4_MANES|nr:hypothetical protein MANES_04G021101v8 [Manihot esculenta]